MLRAAGVVGELARVEVVRLRPVILDASNERLGAEGVTFLRKMFESPVRRMSFIEDTQGARCACTSCGREGATGSGRLDASPRMWE